MTNIAKRGSILLSGSILFRGRSDNDRTVRVLSCRITLYEIGALLRCTIHECVFTHIFSVRNCVWTSHGSIYDWSLLLVQNDERYEYEYEKRQEKHLYYIG
jgi:hypothetical protein